MILHNEFTPSYLPTQKETSKVLDIYHECDNKDVFFILFRKENGELTQRVASYLRYNSRSETMRFWSCMEGVEGGYRTAKLANIFSLTKVCRSQVAKLEFAGRV